jgi:hypothetical protein
MVCFVENKYFSKQPSLLSLRRLLDAYNFLPSCPNSQVLQIGESKITKDSLLRRLWKKTFRHGVVQNPSQRRIGLGPDVCQLTVHRYLIENGKHPFQFYFTRICFSSYSSSKFGQSYTNFDFLCNQQRECNIFLIVNCQKLFKLVFF